jgi:hypothetical protein
MSVESIRYASQQTADTSSKWSPAVWQGFPLEAVKNGTVDGRLYEWDFGEFKPSTNVNAAEAYWEKGLMVFGSDGFAITALAGTGLDTGATLGSDGDNEGGCVRHEVAPFTISRSAKHLVLEVVLETSTITDTKHGFLVGLMENTAGTSTVPITAAGALADKNLVGFHRLEADGDKLDLVYKADGVTAVTVLADAVTLAVDTEVRLGLVFRPETDFDTSSRYLLRWFANNQPIATGYKQIPSAAGTDFPNDIGLGFFAALLNATGSTPGTTTLKRARIAQVI